jgi:hypothetical protein
MIENLKETLPSYRQEELKRQLSLLDREAKRLFHIQKKSRWRRLRTPRGWEDIRARLRGN